MYYYNLSEPLIKFPSTIFNCNDFLRFNFVFKKKKKKIPTSKLKTSTTLHLCRWNRAELCLKIHPTAITTHGLFIIWPQ